MPNSNKMFSRWWGRVRNLIRTALLVRAPLIVTIVGLAVVDTAQFREIFFIIVQNPLIAQQLEVNPLVFAVVSTFMAALFIWLSARAITLKSHSGFTLDAEYEDFAAFYLLWLPLLLPIAFLYFSLSAFDAAYVSNEITTAVAITAKVLRWISAALFWGICTWFLVVALTGAESLIPYRWTPDGPLVRRLFQIPSHGAQTPDRLSVPEWTYESIVSMIAAAFRRIVDTFRTWCGDVDKNSLIVDQYRILDLEPLVGMTTAAESSTEPSLWRQAFHSNPFLYLWLTIVVMFFLVIVPATLIVSLVSFFAVPITLAQALGSVAILHGFVMASVVMLSWLSIRLDKHGVPVFGLLAFLAVIGSLFDGTDNHRFWHTPNAALPSRGLIESYDAWLRSRKDLDRFKEDAYPVYVVAARGGGFMQRIMPPCF